MAASPKRPPVGKKRTTKPRKTLSRHEKAFVSNLSALVGDQARRVADEMGVSHDAVLKWCRGDSIPSLDKWPALAKALGLSDWRDLLPPL